MPENPRPESASPEKDTTSPATPSPDVTPILPAAPSTLAASPQAASAPLPEPTPAMPSADVPFSGKRIFPAPASTKTGSSNAPAPGGSSPASGSAIPTITPAATDNTPATPPAEDAPASPGSVTPQTPPVAKPRRRGCLKMIGVAVAALLLVGIGLRVFYFNDTYIRNRLVMELDRTLGVQTSIEQLELSLFSNRLTLHGVRMENTNAPASHAEFLEVERIEATCAPWATALTGFRRLVGVEVDIHAPAIHVTRLRDPGMLPVTNIDPVLMRLLELPWLEWATLLNIPDLRGVTRVHGASVTFGDEARELGRSEMSDLTVVIHHEGLAVPGGLELTFDLKTPETPTGGRVEARGEWMWGEFGAELTSSMVRDLKTEVAFDRLDLPYLARYLGIGGPLAGGEFHWSLGRPVRGRILLDARDLSSIETEGRVETPGIFSLWQQDTWRAGRIAGRIDWKGSGGLDENGLRLEPTRIDLALAHTLEELDATDARRALDVGLTFSGSQGEGFRFSATSRSHLERLFATDVGALLHLQDQMGGLLDLSAQASLTPDGAWTAEATLRSEDTYILVENVRQPTESAMTARIALQPDARGWPERGEIELDCQAGFMTLKSVDTIRLDGLNSLATVHGTGHVEFRMDLRQMWMEYGPLLSLIGLPHPLSEEVAGRVRFEGTPGSLTVIPHAVIRSKDADTLPLRLDGRMLYHGEALAMNPENPFLDLTLRLLQQETEATRPHLQVLLYGTAQKVDGGGLSWLLRQQATGQLEAIQPLAERAGAYASDLIPEGMQMQGGFSNQTSIRLTQRFDPDGHPLSMTAQASARLDLSAFSIRAPAWMDGAAPFHWREPSLQSSARFSVEWTPERLLATVQEADISSTLLAARLHVGRTEPLMLLDRIQAEPFSYPRIVAALPRFRVQTQLKTVPERTFVPPDFTAFLPADLRPLVPTGGTFRLHANYDPGSHLLDIQELQFHASTLFAACRDMTLPLDRLAHALATGELLPFLQRLSDFRVEGWATPPVFRALQEKALLPSDLPLLGTGTLKAAYTAANKSLQIEELTFREAPQSGSLVRLASLQGEILDPFSITDTIDPVQLPRHVGPSGIQIQALDLSPTALTDSLHTLGVSLPEHGVTLRQLALRDLTCLPDERAGWFRIAGTLFTALRIVDTDDPSDLILDLNGPVTLSPGAPMYLAIGGERIGISGTLLLDRAAVEFRGAYPYLYKKPADELARLSIRMDATNLQHLRIQNLVLHGGQQPFEAQDFILSIDPETLALSLRALDIKDPLGIALRDVKLNTTADRLAFSMQAPRIDLAALHPHLDTAKPFSMQGELTGLALSYDGPFSLFRRVGSGAVPTGGSSHIAATAAHILLRATEPGESHTFGMRLASVGGALETGTFVAHDVVISSPHGFHRTDPIKIKNVRLVVDLSSLATDTLVIKELTLDGVDATLEMGLGNNNLTHIQNAVTYFQACMDTQSGEGKGMVIRDFYMKNSVVRASPRPLRGLSIIPPTPLPDLHLTNVTGDGGAAVFTQVAGAMIGSVLNVGMNVVRGIGTGAGRVVEGAGGAVRNVGSGIGGGLRRVIGGRGDDAHHDDAHHEETPDAP